MKNKTVLLFFALFVLAIISWGIYELRYQYSYSRDLNDKPWAYSKDASAKLLVGKWRGSFIDPAGIVKNIALEIYVPTTEEEREKSASKFKRRRRSRSKGDKRHFDGVAKVESKRGVENYTFYGYVGKEDVHTFDMTFGYEDENKKLLSNFALNLGQKGNWRGDTLSMELHFSFISEKGSAFWDSGNPQHQQTPVIVLHREL